MDFLLFEPGRVLDDKYEVIERLGSGGYGTILKVREIGGEQAYALKYCTRSDEDYLRFKREIAILEDLQIESVIPIIHSELNAEVPYYVMPLAEGSLDDLQVDRNLPEVLALFKKVCRAVHRVHGEKIYHRDLKPQNVLLINGEPYVADFGLARRGQSQSEGLTTAGLGTREYAAPEQYKTGEADARTDVFALGKLLYWLLTGTPPFVLDLTRVPQGMAVIVRKATEQEPADRFAGVDGLLNALDIFEAMSTPGTLPADAVEPSPALTVATQALSATINRARPDVIREARKFWGELYADLEQHTPFDRFGASKVEYTYDDFLTSLKGTILAAIAFSVAAEEAAAMHSLDGVHALYRGFERIAARCELPRGVGGYIEERAFDFWRFIGHELFATLFAAILRNEFWDAASILNEEFYVDARRDRNKMTQSYECLSETVLFFYQRDHRSIDGRRTHAIILRERHHETELAAVSPIEDLCEADYFLGLRSAFAGSYDEPRLKTFWAPHSIAYTMRPPQFLLRSNRADYASRLLKPLGVAGLAEFRELMAKHKGFSKRVASPFNEPPADSWFDPETIGTVP